MSEEEILKRIELLDNEIYENERENYLLQLEIDGLFKELDKMGYNYE